MGLKSRGNWLVSIEICKKCKKLKGDCACKVEENTDEKAKGGQVAQE